MTAEKWQYQRIEDVSRELASKVKQFGLEVLRDEPDEFQEIRSQFVSVGSWAMENSREILAAISGAKPFTVLIGMRPNQAFHLGHLTLMREVAFLTERGGVPVFILATYEAGNHASKIEITASVASFRQCYSDFLAREFPPSATVFSDADCLPLRKLEDKVAERLTLSKIAQLYGWKQSGTVATARKASMTAAAFLLPSLMWPDRPALILTDINQAPHAEATRIAGRALKMRLPSYSYRLLMPSLLGPENRMSVKDPRSLLQLQELRTIAAEKLKRSFSGGRATLIEQQKSGGQPQICSFFRAAEALGSADQTRGMYRACIGGETTCSDCKSRNLSKLTARFPSDKLTGEASLAHA